MERRSQVRVVTGMSGLLVAFSLIVMIHCAIVNKHIRDSQVTNGLSSATDYATNVCQDMYESLDFEAMDKAEAKKQIISVFCKALESVIGTDGDVWVYVAKADLEIGLFDFVVEENYKYSFRGRTGTARCERVVCFGAE